MSASRDLLPVYFRKKHHLYGKACAAHGIATWEQLIELLKKPVHEILELRGVGPSIVYAWQTALYDVGLGEDPGDWRLFMQMIQAGPDILGFGPAKKLGLTKDVQELLSRLGCADWDAVAALSNRMLPQCVASWKLRQAQFLVGKGPDPGACPQTIDDWIRFRNGLKVGEQVPPLDADAATKLQHLSATVRDNLAKAREALEAIRPIVGEMQTLLYGHVGDRHDMRRFFKEMDCWGSLLVEPHRNELYGELTGYSYGYGYIGYDLL